MTDFLDGFSRYSNLIVLFVPFFLGIFLIAMQSKFPTREEFKKLKDAHEVVDDKTKHLETKIHYMEKSMEQLPNIETIHGLSLQMTELNGKLENINTRFGNVSAVSDRLQLQVDRLEEFLKKRG